jgi:hypothetical protein
MTLINIVVILIQVGLALWLVNTYIPMFAAAASIAARRLEAAIMNWLTLERQRRTLSMGQVRRRYQTHS